MPRGGLLAWPASRCPTPGRSGDAPASRNRTRWTVRCFARVSACGSGAVRCSAGISAPGSGAVRENAVNPSMGAPGAASMRRTVSRTAPEPGAGCRRERAVAASGFEEDGAETASGCLDAAVHLQAAPASGVRPARKAVRPMDAAPRAPQDGVTASLRAGRTSEASGPAPAPSFASQPTASAHRVARHAASRTDVHRTDGNRHRGLVSSICTSPICRSRKPPSQ